MEKKLRHVLLLLGWYSPLLHFGVSRYARTHNWHLVIRYNYCRSWPMPDWNGDGVIVNGECFRNVRFEAATVAISHFPENYHYQLVREDDAAIGIIAAEYFLSHGFRNVAMYATGKSVRLVTCERELNARGICCHVLHRGDRSLVAQEPAFLGAQLRRLPLPCAVFCENDLYAYDIVDAALAAGLAIPDQVAILGVGNDELICESGSVTLSAIDSHLDQVGYRAAAELDRLMGGEAPGEPVFIAPHPEVIQRMSSDVFAVRNPKLRDILTFFQRNFPSAISIAEVAARHSLSESAMYKLFRRNLNTSPAEVLMKLRLSRAVFLLKGNDLKIGVIASEAGFGDANAMYCAFRKYLKSTPGEIRNLQNSRRPATYGLRAEQGSRGDEAGGGGTC